MNLDFVYNKSIYLSINNKAHYDHVCYSEEGTCDDAVAYVGGPIGCKSPELGSTPVESRRLFHAPLHLIIFGGCLAQLAYT